MASEDRVLGRIGITLKGEYDNNKTYTKLNQVTHQGGSYTLKVAKAKGILPTNEDYWICSARPGEKGDKGDKGEKGDTGAQGPQGEQGIQGIQGEQGEKGDKGDKPVSGVDYFTEEEKEIFKQAVVKDSKTEIDTHTADKITEFNNNATEKINTFNSNAEEKIADYNAHVETLTSRIADLEEETEDLFNALDTEKISGTELYIEDAKPCRVINTEISGMYKQETTAGANLLDTSDMLFNNGTLEQNGLTAKINTDGSIVINGTATANTYFKKSIKNILEDGNYYFYNFNNVTQSNSTYYMLIQGNKSTGYGSTDYYNARGYQTDNFIKDIITYDRTFDCTFVFINGFVANNLILYPEISKTEQTVFEPYTGGELSPNPNYLQEIEQIKEVKYCGTAKNLLNFNEISGKANNFEYSVNGTYINIKGTSLGTYATSNKMRCHIEKNEVVTIKITSAKSGTYRLWIRNKKNELITNPIICNASASGIKTITVKDNVETVQLITEHLTSEATYTDTITIQIEKGQNATETEEYKKRTINIDLKGNKLCAISDTIKDKLLIDKNGNVALQKNINYSTFDAFTTVNGSFSDRTQFILTLVNCVKGVEQNRFSAISNCMLKNTVVGGMGYYGTTTNGSVRVTVSNDLLGITQEDTTNTKLNAAKTFLQNLQQTPEIYYPAEVPELIDLGQLTELPKTFNGINNIWAETNLGNTEIEIEYVQDVKKLLEKQSEQQNARLDNIEALLSTTETSALLLDNMQTDLESEVK